jgi:hypothetical protein
MIAEIYKEGEKRSQPKKFPFPQKEKPDSEPGFCLVFSCYLCIGREIFALQASDSGFLSIG